MSEVITAEGLSRRFGDRLALDALSLGVRAGTVLGLLGPNGAGKTTAMRLIAGVLAPDAGRACIAGHDVQLAPMAARAALGYLPEGAPLYPEMTPTELLGFVADSHGLGRGAIAPLLDRLALAAAAHRPVDTLSRGTRRRVALAAALIHRPPALVLDEPTDGLDPLQKQAVRALIRDHADAGGAVLMSTHLLEEVSALCDAVVVLAHGREVARGTPAALRQRSRVAQAVRVTVPEGAVAGLIAALGLPATTAPASDGLVGLTLLAPDGQPIAGAVLAALAAAGVAPHGFSVDPGQLDDVFAAVVTGGNAP